MGTPGPCASSHAGNSRRSPGHLGGVGGGWWGAEGPGPPGWAASPRGYIRVSPGLVLAPTLSLCRYQNQRPRLSPLSAPCSVTSQPPALSPPLLCHLSAPRSVTSPALSPPQPPSAVPSPCPGSFLHPEIRRVRGTGFGSRTWHSCHSGPCRVHGTCWQDLSLSAASEHPPECLLQPWLVQGPQVSFPA